MQREEVSALFGKTYISELILNKHLKYSVDAVNQISDLERFCIFSQILNFAFQNEFIIWSYSGSAKTQSELQRLLSQSTVWQYLSV